VGLTVAGQYFEFIRNLSPYLMRMNGRGIKTTEMQPKRVPAHLAPRASNMRLAKRGKAAPARLRQMVFAARAEAATARYESMM